MLWPVSDRVPWRGQRPAPAIFRIGSKAGGSANHNRIARNVVIALSHALADKPCEAFITDLRLLIEPVGLYTYPDVMAICGDLRFVPGRTDAVTNPVIIFEVLSPSTESYDRGKKFESYRTLETREDYVLINQERVHIEHYRRMENNQWLLSVLDDEADTLLLQSIDVEMPLSEIYQRVVWD